MFVAAYQRVYCSVARGCAELRLLVFVLLCYRDDAERAIRTLNGYGYDNLILHVEWAAPRAERT